MSAKTSADVLIGGKIYTLSGYESEAYLQRVAAYMNNKINEFDEMEQYRRLPVDMKSTLLELNIADDYFKAKEQAQKLEQDIEMKEKEIYDLKHELISAQIKLENNEKSITELERENKILLLNKAKLESSLEDALLGKVKGQIQPEHVPSFDSCKVSGPYSKGETVAETSFMDAEPESVEGSQEWLQESGEYSRDSAEEVSTERGESVFTEEPAQKGSHSNRSNQRSHPNNKKKK